ncbi:phage recombination protein Bet [Streptomyces sp. NPDC047821]|uniref:phage recombination protein Bet n=1 Tax=Streptomyces sp. NPDC047821 TaxID=3365488 RepID=UPI003710F615
MSSEISKAVGALAIRPDQTNWTPEQAAVLRQSGINDHVTAAELAGFLHLCQRTQLDPFSRQIYLIGRWDKRAQREVFTPQTGIDGYRVVAHRVIAASGETFGYEDTMWCDASGRWRDAWLAQEPPAAAKVTVLRNGQRFSAVALFREYVQTNKDGRPIGLWGKMPAGQVAKCAEALALRKAFPHDLAGVYTAEEMAQADNPTAEERHLRRVQPGESDPWATPEPQTVAVKGRSQSAQEIADVAGTTTDQSVVKELYRQAHGEGLLAETVKTADRELLELGAYLIARGQQLAEPVPSADSRDDDAGADAETGGPAPYSYSDAIAAEPTVSKGPSEAEVAERQLRTVAARVGLDNLDAEFEQSYGIPIAQAGVQQLTEMTQLLGGVAA